MAKPEAGAEPRVAGIVLAAGTSRRFAGDTPKQLHEIDGETLVHRVARAALASRLHQTVVVVGHRAVEIEAALAGLTLEIAENLDFERGQSTSVRIGLSRVAPDADAAMFIPCDLPNLEAKTLDRLLTAYSESGGPIVVPLAEGKRRAPAIFSRGLFEEIRGISGDQGARQLFPPHEREIVEIPFASGRPFEDLDRIDPPSERR